MDSPQLESSAHDSSPPTVVLGLDDADIQRAKFRLRTSGGGQNEEPTRRKVTQRDAEVESHGVSGMCMLGLLLVRFFC